MDKGIMALFAIFAVMFVGTANADVPGRPLPAGAIPNPGTQEQELGNITFPAEWNVFEFVVTCGACHSGTVDQHTGHFGNWAGSNMASATRDPVFRANQIGVNATVKAVTGQDGAGNMCFRCHSPNGWLSGRFDPALGGAPDGSTLIQSILLSTDGEGVMCETCHRVVGAVTYKRPDVLNNATTGVLDSVWNVLAGVFDWPHQGHAPIDQAGDPTIAPGMPYGDTTLQFNDQMTYGGKYSGVVDLYFSDVPLGGTYTGQIYAVYPDWWQLAGNPMNAVPPGMPAKNSAGQYIHYNTDGTLPPVMEVTVGPPTKGNPVNQMQAISMEHSTFGAQGRKTSAWDMVNPLSPILPPGPGGSPSANAFITTSEFCGTCHELTVPVLNHNMPEQRTYTEWKFSDYSKSTNVGWDPIKKQVWKGEQRCQDCHMPMLKHEYTDLDTGSYNPDPFFASAYPYRKDRAPNGGTAFHKLTGANRDLPQMMKAIYPEVDLEVIGAPSGRDPRAFPGMLSDRGPMFDRATQNTDITLRDALDVQITQAPTEVQGQPGVYEMKVKVTNNSGHRVPTGYPDGRRFWLSVAAKDPAGSNVYESGVYDQPQATLNTAAGVPFNRSLSNVIDAAAGNNAVMVYERVTGVCLDAAGAAIFPDPTTGVPAACIDSTALTNNFILFDNRIPPKGFTYQDYRTAGIKFWNYDAATKVPYEQGGPAAAKVPQRYADGQNWDEVTYRFTAAPGQTLTATAEVYWQTHTREFMEHLRDSDASTLRPEGPPNPLDPNYPATPTFLSNQINGKTLATIIDPFKNAPLNDNWGGVAYASWLETGMGAPFLVDRADSAVTAAPAAPVALARALNANDPGYLDPVLLAPDAFAAKIEWTPVADADGYEVWVLYGTPNSANPGKPTATADWDRLAVVGANATSHTEFVLSEASVNSPGKTYGFKVVAFNSKGSTESNVVTHKVASGLPAAPTTLKASIAAPASSNSQITLTWFDNANNEGNFEIWRYPSLVNGFGFGLATIINAPTQTGGAPGTPGATGTNTYVDADPALVPNHCYFYQIRAVGQVLGYVSLWTAPFVQGCTTGAAVATPKITLTGTAVDGYTANLNWTTANAANVASYKLSRNGVFAGVAGAAATSFTDATLKPNGTYTYIVGAYDAANVLLTDATVTVTTPAVLAAPANVTAKLGMLPGQVTINWTDNEAAENNYNLERASVENGVIGAFVPVTGMIPAVTGVGGKGTFVDNVSLLGSFAYRIQATSKTQGSSLFATSNTVVVGVVAPTGMGVTTATAPVAGPYATNSTGGGVTANLTWFDNAKNEDSYEVQSCVGNTFSCSATSTFGWNDADGKPGTTVLPANSTSAVGHAAPQTTASQVFFRVRGVAAGVPSTWMVSAGTNIPAGPYKPMIYSAMAGTTDVAPGMPRISVSWGTAMGATSYVLERSADAGATWTTVATQPTAGFVDTAATGLVGGASYQYRVVALNANGWNSSTVSMSVTLPAAPAALTITSVAPGGFGTMQRTMLAVKFTVPMLSYGSGWTLEYSPAGAGAWKVAATSSMSGTVTQNISGLNPGTAYDVRVRMYNQGGYSAWSPVVTGTTAP